MKGESSSCSGKPQPQQAGNSPQLWKTTALTGWKLPLLPSVFFLISVLCPLSSVFSQDGARPDATRKKTFTAAEPFLAYQLENLEQIQQGNTTVIRLQRRPDTPLASDDLLLDFEHAALFKNPAHQSLILKQSLERIPVDTLSGKAAQFNLPGHQIMLRLPPYLHLSGNGGSAGDFSFFCEFLPETAGGEILHRENFVAGKQYLFSVALRNGLVVVRLVNLLSAQNDNGEKLLDSLSLRSLDKVKQGKRNTLLLAYHEAEGRLELRLNGREQAVQFLRRRSEENFVLDFTPLSKAPFVLFSPYRGYADNILFSNRILGDGDVLHFGALKPYGDRYEQRQGRLVSDIFDLGYSRSTIAAVSAQTEHDAETALQLSLRCADKRFAAYESDRRLRFVDFRKAAGLRCRFVQFQAHFTADNAGERSPTLRSISIEYRENPPPAAPLPPKIISARDEILEIELSPNTELDMVHGGRYFIHYGHNKYMREGTFHFIANGKPIEHKVPIRLRLTNEILAQNKKWADQSPRFSGRYPVFEKGVGYYFWVTACDNAWSEAEEHSDHCSWPSAPVFARFE